MVKKYCVGEPGSTLFIKNIPALQVCVWISLVHNITGVLYFSRVVTHFIVHVLSELVLFSVQCSSQAVLAI